VCEQARGLIAVVGYLGMAVARSAPPWTSSPALLAPVWRVSDELAGSWLAEKLPLFG
jgi:hypothetical protein